jgi:hypothetical protein
MSFVYSCKGHTYMTEACCATTGEYHHRVMVKYKHTSTHMWTHHDKRPYRLNGTCCYNSCTTLNPHRLQSVSGLNTAPLCSWALSLEDCAYCTGFSGVMLAWHDNPNLYQYILWVSTHQNQQLIKWNNKLKILLQMLPLEFWRRSDEFASSMF